MSAEDYGQVPDLIQSALTMWLQHPSDLTHRALISAISQSRLLVPLREQKTESGNEMVQVTFQARDGRKALLAFTSVESLARFDQVARPLAMYATTLALQALEQNYDGLIIDIKDSHRIALRPSDVAFIANV